ncbi:Protein of unknown function (DUF2721) [Leptolyngbyaceae cyanobacterium JSC-12]|nr:Protein of unknown function (DUF2721) [Leptolyngbyaceae cyanobacterium JSC-12]
MSVEQTTQLIQLILNSVLMSVACALVLGGLTARHSAIAEQLQALHFTEELTLEPTRSRRGQSRNQIRRLQYRYTLSRYSVVVAYYALFFAIVSCLTLALRGIINWNGLISLALVLFVVGVATLLVSVGLTLVDWHLSDRPMLDEARRLLSMGKDDRLSHWQQKFHHSGSSSRPTALTRNNRQKMRVG